MTTNEISTWVLIRRYDLLENKAAELQSSLHRLTLTSGTVLDDLSAIVLRVIGVEDDDTKVLKIRRHDNNLIPISSLLNGSEKKKPFIIDIVGVHQFCPVEQRTILPEYTEALKIKFDNLKKRVVSAEKALPEITIARIRAAEETTLQLSNCLHFLDRRLDELAPPDWRSQILSAI